MAEEKDMALLADNDIIVEIEVQDAPTVVIETTSTTTAEISGDSAIGFVVSALPTLAKEETLTNGISSIESKFDNIKVDLTPVAKEETLVEESRSIKDKIDAIPATDLSQVAKETTLTQGISEIKSAVTNIDLSTVAKEATLTSGVNELKTAIENLDLSSVESKVEEESQAIQNKIDNIDLTPVENKVDEGVSALSIKIDNIKLPEIDTTELAKQGENAEATNSKILEEIGNVATALTAINDILGTL
jgi:hypothetical protein